MTLGEYLQKRRRGLIPNSKVTIIENGPIDVNRLMPKEFAEAILNFLQ